jgi:autotransporter-associated beta strand protein
VLIAVALVVDARAANYHWDTNGSSAGLGSAGGAAADWLTNSWATGSTGTLPVGAWPNSQPDNADTAVFAGTAGTVNLNGDVHANGFTFQTHGYLVSSTGGALHLAGEEPTITVNLPSGNNTATITAPIRGENGFTLAGNSLTGGLKFLVLANTSAATPNDFSGTLTIEAGGALRLGGGAAHEQIPDDVDLDVAGVLDFITSGAASDGKQERVRDVAVAGTVANFSVGNEADFIVNSISAAGNGTGQGIAINGNSAASPNAPARLIINGWSDGAGDLTLDNGRVRITTTGSSFGVGGRVLLSGNLHSSGNSEIWNHNGGPTTPDDHVFVNKALDFTSAAHVIDVASGTLTMTSRAAIQPLDITSTHAGGTTLTKTGLGTLLLEHATQTSFTGTNRIEQGTLRLAASERLANSSRLELAGGTFDMQGFSERVGNVLLETGTIAATGAATLTSNSIEVRSGTIEPRLGGIANLSKTSEGVVDLNGQNTYAGTTTVSAGTLRVNGTHSGSGYTIGPEGTLAGGGAISSSLSVDGAVAPGISIGTLTVQGDVEFNPGSRLVIELAGAAADKLIVNGGTGHLDLSAADVALDVSGVGSGNSWVIAAYSSLSGTFTSITPGYAVDYGTGVNGQITLLPVPELIGDYNDDGTVDAVDYTVWRNNVGNVSSTLANRDPANGMGPVDAADYTSWKTHYGESAGGSGGIVGHFAVPETETVRLLLLSIVVQGCHWRNPRAAR